MLITVVWFDLLIVLDIAIRNGMCFGFMFMCWFSVWLVIRLLVLVCVIGGYGVMALIAV